MKGGWIGIMQNEEIVNKNTKVKVKLKEIPKLKQYKNEESRIKKDEEAVQNANECLQKWNSAPWDTDLTTLRSLESGLLASVKFQEDFLRNLEGRSSKYFSRKESY